ncbi:acetylglutamate kinase [Brevibacillus gelatini]|uniref:acetylglutamate kinase n=1 Tax=Brevibacillus gelatini TaxID=1655277 RepID=UPI003D816126
MYVFSPNYYGYDFRQIAIMAWTPSEVALNRKLRVLWEQHVYWTRLAVNSIVGDLPDKDETIKRLLRNATDFAAAFEPFYGKAIAARFGDLMKRHLTIAAELVQALKTGNTSAAADAQKRWFANADDIAVFLGRINPFWSTEEWRRMLDEHLKLLSSEVTSRIAGNYAENIALSDRIESQALEMADVMTSGIIQQFPMAFSA